MTDLANGYRKAMSYGLENGLSYSDAELFPEFKDATQSILDAAADGMAENLENAFGGNAETQARVRAIVDEWLESGDYDLSTLRERLQELPDFSPARALMVARTETAEAFNGANLVSLKAHGWTQFEWNAAFDACEDCIARAEGGPYTAEQITAEGVIEHPNCRCTIDPVLPEDEDES